jgi:hypothetical protein
MIGITKLMHNVIKKPKNAFSVHIYLVKNSQILPKSLYLKLGA